jgi:hypothetical protein
VSDRYEQEAQQDPVESGAQGYGGDEGERAARL